MAVIPNLFKSAYEKMLILSKIFIKVYGVTKNALLVEEQIKHLYD
jgi:hypothetical protein